MNVKGIVIVSFVTLLWGVIPARAQFEVAPDHFEPAAAAGRKETSPQKEIRQISDHQRSLESLRARIKAKYQEVQAALQEVFTNGTEAGQDLVFAARQKELGTVLRSLGPQISDEERTIAMLQTQLQRLELRASRAGERQGRSNQLAHDVVFGLPATASTR